MAISIGSRPPPSVNSVSSSPSTSTTSSAASAGPVDSFTPSPSYSQTPDQIKAMSDADIAKITPNDVKTMSQAQLLAYESKAPNPMPADLQKATTSRSFVLGIIQAATDEIKNSAQKKPDDLD